MASLYDSASLALIPSGVKDGKAYSIKPTDGSGDFTFSRGTGTATRVNASGLIEKERGNLFTYSNTFSDSSWNKSETSVTSGQSGYDGSSDAWNLIPSTTNTNSHRLYKDYSSSEGILTASIYAKANGYDFLKISNYSSSGVFDISIGNPTSGTIISEGGSPIDANIQSVGSGWYRIDVAKDSPSGNVRIQFIVQSDAANTSFSGDGVKGVLIQDAMLNQGLVAQPYIETTSSAVYEGITDNLPRLDYSGGASCPSLLLESSRTNLITQSEYLGSSDWTDAGTTRTLSSTTNPSGYAQSYVIAAPSSATNAIRYDFTFSASTDYSYSVFLKAGTSEEVRMQIYDGNTFQRLAVNPLNDFEVVDQSGINSYSIEDFANGWKRVVMNFTTTASAGTGYLQIYPDRTGNLNNVEAWGAQLEAGSYPTSYIPTYGTSASRADEFAILGGDLQAKGIFSTRWTFLYDQTFVDVPRDGANALLLYQSVGGTNNVRLSLNSDGSYRLQDSENGVTGITSGNKILCRFDGSTIDWYVDGVQVASDSVTPSNFEEIYLDNRSSATLKPVRLNKHLMFATALTDAECIALTTI